MSNELKPAVSQPQPTPPIAGIGNQLPALGGMYDLCDGFRRRRTQGRRGWGR